MLGDVRAEGAVERLTRVNGANVLFEFAKLAEGRFAEFAGVWSVSRVNIQMVLVRYFGYKRLMANFAN